MEFLYVLFYLIYFLPFNLTFSSFHFFQNFSFYLKVFFLVSSLDVYYFLHIFEFLFSFYFIILCLMLFFFLLSYAHCSTCSIVSSSFLHNGHDSCFSFFYNSFSRPFSVILFSPFIILIALDFVIFYLLTKYF